MSSKILLGLESIGCGRKESIFSEIDRRMSFNSLSLRSFEPFMALVMDKPGASGMMPSLAQMAGAGEIRLVMGGKKRSKSKPDSKSDSEPESES